MTPQEATGALDDALAQAGESVRFLRMAKPPATGVVASVTCQALIRGYAPSDLSPGSGIGQQDQLLIVSPTPIVAAGWPGAGSPIPAQGDRVQTARGTLTIQASAGTYMQGTLVRIEIQVRGS
jgi:hypothetical protein